MKLKKVILGVLGLVLILFLGACSQDKESAQVTYEGDVREILSQSCLSCHGGNAPSLAEFGQDKEHFKSLMKGPRFDNYEELIVLVNGEDAGALMRRLDDGTNTEEGKPGNMYDRLGKTEEERQENLAILKEWTGSWSLERSKDLTPEERAAITAPEK